ncbi:MAG TPA: HXXEE domain-containing protein [Pyrinomonadaceae bacterium]|nr:HXXEE domain-containing protein [Pyrinomonadaceae bacterium]
MSKADAAPQGRLFENWIWLFPLTYLIHALEEYWCGEGFYRWIARLIGRGMTPEQFVQINSFGWLMMVAGVLIFRKTPSVRWLTITFATVVFINGLAHLAGSILTLSYSPGVVSGVLLWIPLGAATFYRARGRVTRRSYVAGVVAGLVIHLMLFMVLASFR